MKKLMVFHLDGTLADADMSSIENLSILPTSGTKFFRYTDTWKNLYSEDFTPEEKQKIIASLKKAVAEVGFQVDKVWGEVIEDLEEKEKWDSDFAKRTKIKAIVDDVTKPGIDKPYGIRKLRDVLGISLQEMIYVGVRGPHETKRVIQMSIACLSDHGQEPVTL